MNRRKFLQQLGLAAGATIIPIGWNGWAARTLAQSSNPKRLIVIFLRGGVDGLNLVVPYQEPNYYEARPTLALAAPSQKDGVLDLDGQFGLHPNLKALMPLWKKGELAFIHACGSPSNSRSHFEAQDNMEAGIPEQRRAANDGWMNRLLGALPQGTPVQAVSVSSRIPLILSGALPATNISAGKAATRPLPLDQPHVNQAFDQLYQGHGKLSQAYEEGQAAREIIVAELEAEREQANRGAASPSQLARDARNLARLMKGDSKTQLAFLEVGKWDTHVAQAGQLKRLFNPLATGIMSLVKELGPIYQDTAIIVMSEFGRTVKENGNRGTDHGHGNVLWVLGGGVNGGKVQGQWPGLEQSQRYEGRDLAITTDFRDAISSVLQPHLQLNSSQLAQVFPQYSVNTSLNLMR
ncbi:MAG: DUF1501 domain-containing protein [Microcoleaceae cyanobacterium]